MSERVRFLGVLRFKIAWWLEGCPFTRRLGLERYEALWRDHPPYVPWDYRLGMRIMPSS